MSTVGLGGVGAVAVFGVVFELVWVFGLRCGVLLMCASYIYVDLCGLLQGTIGKGEILAHCYIAMNA